MGRFATDPGRAHRRLRLYGAGGVAGIVLAVALNFASPAPGRVEPLGEPGAASQTSLADGFPSPSSEFVLIPPGAGFEAPAVEAPPAAAPEPAPVAAQEVVEEPAPQPAALPQPPAEPTASPEPAPAPAPAATPASVAYKPGFYLPAVAGGPATGPEQRLLDGINAERAKAGLAPYVYDAALGNVARVRSQQLADQAYFAHVDPYGYVMYTELLAYFGIPFAWAGENLAMNNYEAAISAERALVSLMNSPGHRANILDGDFTRIGVGEVTTASGSHYFTMIFVG